MSITLEDVETAIKVLKLFLNKQKEASRILRELGVYERGFRRQGFSMEDFMSMALETAQARRSELKPEIEESEELTEEDKKRLSEIKKKLGI